MKRTNTALLATAVAAALAVWAPTMKHGLTTLPVVHAQSGCSNAILTGNYGVNMQGFDSRSRGSIANAPINQVGVIGFDGAGNLTLNYSGSNAGRIFTGNSDVGTYAVNADCTGSLVDTSAGVTANMVILGGGAEGYFVLTTNGWAENAVFKKQ